MRKGEPRKQKTNPILYLTKKVWEYSSGNRENVVLYLVLFLIANATSLAEPLIVAKILNTVQEQGVTQETLPVLLFLLSLFVLLGLAFWAFHGPARVIERRNAFLVRANYKKYLLDGVMGFPLEWHTNHHSGDTIDKIEKGTNALYRYAEDTFTVIESVVRLVGSYIALVYFNLHSAYLVLFLFALTFWLIAAFDRILVRQYKDLYGAENKISERIYDVIGNITTVIILRVERLVSKSIMKRIMAPLSLYHENNRINETKWFLVSVLSNVMIVAILGSYLYTSLGAGAAILVGTLYALYGYVQNISGLFFRFAYMWSDLVRQRAAVMNAEEISNEFRRRRHIRQVGLSPQWRELKIESLSFSYHTEGGRDLHLDDISMPIRKGERIALIGESGSGKTTLLKIIRELHHPRQGKIYLDGKLLRSGFGDVSDAIALIPQDPEIFTTTILENITIGIPYALNHVKRFTDMACFTDVAERLPKKFNSSIVEKGVNLSGGERQRLALARGLLACEDKAIVLLDEPTSSVDAQNELRIYANIFREFKGKTVIASVHRLHLLPMFDEIYFFKNGRVVASGTFEKLLESSAEFRTQWDRYMRTKRANPE